MLRAMSCPEFGLVRLVEPGADRLGRHPPDSTMIRMPVEPSRRIKGKHEVRSPAPDSLHEPIDDAARVNLTKPPVGVIPDFLAIDTEHEPISPELGFANQCQILLARHVWF
jgi:hypothetical protein